MRIFSFRKNLYYLICFQVFALQTFGQCDATFDFYNNKWKRANNTTFRPVILGDHGGTFTSNPPGLVFNDINTGEINLTTGTNPDIYTITYTVGACSSSQEIVILAQGTSIVDLCNDTLDFIAGANCDAQVTFSWPPEIETIFNLNNQSGILSGEMVDVGLDSANGQFNWPLQDNLIAQHQWYDAANSSNEIHSGEAVNIYNPSNYQFTTTGGIAVGPNNADQLSMEIPMNGRTFEGIDVNFDYRRYMPGGFAFPDYATCFFLGDNTTYTVEFGFAFLAECSIGINYLYPDLTTEYLYFTGITWPNDTDLHNYRFIHDPETGISSLYIDGNLVWEKNDNPPGTYLNYTGGNALVGDGGTIAEGLKGYGENSDVTTFGNLEIRELIAQKNRNCTRYFNVEDQDAPLLNCPPSDSLQIHTSTCEAIYNWDLSPSDNCALNSPIFFDDTQVSGAALPVGIHDYSVLIGDVNGNDSQCNWTVHVIDTIAPIAQCLTTQYIIWDEDGSAIMPDLSYLLSARSIDNCTSYNISQFPPAGTLVTESVNQVILELSDPESNSSTCAFPLVWEHPGPHVLTCPDDIQIDNSLNALSCFETVSITEPVTVFGDVLQLSNEGNGSQFIVDSVYSVEYTIEPIIDTIVAFNWNDITNHPRIPEIGPHASNGSANWTYETNPSGGYFLQTTDDLDFEMPMDFFDDLNGIEIGFEYAASNDRYADIVRSDWDLRLDLDSNFYVRYTIQLPNNSFQVINEEDIFDLPMDNEFHSYLFRYDDQTGIATIDLDGIEVWQNSNPIPGAVLYLDPNQEFLIGHNTFSNGLRLDDFYINKYTSNPSCIMTVEVEDVIAPTLISCPEDTTLYSAVSGCDPWFSYSVLANDLCGEVTYNQISGLPSSGGIYTTPSTLNTWEISDESGNLTNCSFTVNYVDDAIDSLTCPVDTILFNDPSICGAHLYFQIDTIFACSNSGYLEEAFTNISSGNVFSVGSSINSYTLYDAADMAIDSCTFQVTVIDNEDPVFVDCPSSDTLYIDSSGCAIDYSYAIAGSDNCSNSSILQIESHEGPLFPGEYDFSYELSDDAGNQVGCNWEIVVRDTVSPVFVQCPDSMVVYSLEDDCGDVVSYILEAIDNCTSQNDIAITQIQGGLNNQFWPLGNFDQIYEARDQAGNYSLCTFFVEVIDSISPAISCPNDTILDSELNICGAEFNFDFEVEDNCVLLQSPQLVAGFDSGSIFPLGTTSNVFEITDESGNASTCSFNVTVIDIQDPIINCPPSQTFSIEQTNCMYNFIHDFDVQENCTIYSIQGNTSEIINDNLALGQYQYDFTVIDGNNNQSNCSFELTIVDENAPQIVCENLMVDVDQNCQYLMPDLFEELELNDCNAIAVNFQSPVPGEVVHGVTEVTFSIVDEFNNISANCIAEIFPNDTIAPEVLCPMDTIVFADPSSCGAILNYEYWAEDNCGLFDTIYSSNNGQNPIEPGTYLEIGEYDLGISVMDISGRRDSCFFHVSLQDNLAPLLFCDTLEFSDSDSNCEEMVVFELAATDNCNIDNIEQLSGPSSGEILELGYYEVEYTASDIYGNRDTCSFILQVSGENTWSIECPSGDTLYVNTCAAEIADYTAQVNINGLCSEVEIVQDIQAFSMISSDTIATISATDEWENSNSCQFEIHLRDTIAPELEISLSSILTDSLICGSIVEYDIVASDNCETTTLNLIEGLASGSTFDFGVQLIVYELFDWYGNSSRDSLLFLVEDTISPELECLPYVDFCGVDVTMDKPIVSDACGIMTLSNSFNNTDNASGIYPEGTSFVTWTAVDRFGNERSCLQEVFVEALPPETFAGDDQNLIFENDSRLNAVLNGLSGFWTIGSGEAVLNAIDDPNSTISGLSIGVNQFIWTETFEVCKAQSDTVGITVFNIGLNNAFSPDGDNRNDELTFEGLEILGPNILKVYNRWGQLIFEEENYENNWKGTTEKGNVLPNDTYFYVLELEEFNKSYNGFVVIKR
ncbi:MAG: HYR domain-containing protein [Bacteroidota bacterium]